MPPNAARSLVVRRVPIARPAPRAEPREVVELRAAQEAQPDLASAADMQIELLGLSGACSRGCRCRRAPSTVASGPHIADQRRPLRVQGHPDRLDRLPADGPADGRHPAAGSTRSSAGHERDSRRSRGSRNASRAGGRAVVRRGARRRHGPTASARRPRSCWIRCCCWRCGRFWRAAPRRCCRRLELSDWASRTARCAAASRNLRSSSGRRAAADLRPLHGPVALRSDRLPYCGTATAAASRRSRAATGATGSTRATRATAT